MSKSLRLLVAGSLLITVPAWGQEMVFMRQRLTGLPDPVIPTSNPSATAIPSRSQVGPGRVRITTGGWTQGPTTLSYDLRWTDGTGAHVRIAGPVQVAYSVKSVEFDVPAAYYGIPIRGRVTARNSRGTGWSQSSLITVAAP
jgi:hypothetical protein